MPPIVLWDDIWKLHGRAVWFSFLCLLVVLPIKTDDVPPPHFLGKDLPPHFASLLPKAKAIDNTLYYSMNKFNHKECYAAGRKGVCMFVWECMKTGGQHGGMCMDGFMFGSCCTTKDVIHDVESSSASPVSSSTSPYTSSSTKLSYSNGILDIVDSNALVSSLTAKPYYVIPSQRPGVLRPVSSQSSSPSIYSTSYLTAEHPSKEFNNSSSEVTLEATTPASTHESSNKWTQSPPITIKPPEAPKRPTRPPKPTKPERPALAPWWAYANKQKKPINKTSTFDSSSSTSTSTTSVTTTTTTTTTTATTTTPTTTTTTTTTNAPTSILATSSTFKPPSVGPYTTNAHSAHACGIPRMSPQPEGRIVNGTNSKFGEFPWQTSVRRISFFGFSSTHRCGGALLNSRWVATAGHCVEDLLVSQIRLRVGEYDFSSVLEPYAYVERKAKKKVVHPNYNFFTYEYDLALVEMESDIEFQPHIQPICLPGNQDLLIGEYAKVTGWGRLSEHGTLPSILQQTSVPLISNDACKQMFLKGGRKEHIPEIFLCAGYEKGGRDSCQGDSGGPLQVKGNDGRWFLAGIISWGIGCAEPNLPGVCTRISKFVPFILEHVT